MISEKEYVISTFRKHFSEYKERKIVVYGIGLNTKNILDGCEDFNIVGLMDPNKFGEMIYGKKILTYDEVVEQRPEAIVVIARPNSAKLIYRRIHNFCEQNNILLFDINKNNLFDLFDYSKLHNENDPYFSTSEVQLREQIMNHEIISFDIFDTLIMRKVLHPQDVFTLVEQKAINNGYDVFGFSQQRAETERMLFLQTNPTIYEIYNALQERLGITDKEKVSLMNIELAIEKQVLIQRKNMVEVLKYAVSCGKKVYLISDMYLPKAILEEILNDLGVYGYIDIYVSCEHRVAKYNGLFPIFKENVHGSSYLHIGDNYDADGIPAIQNGISAFAIKSAVDMLELSTYREVFNHLHTINDRSLVGLFISKVFNNPFSLYQSKGRPEISTLYNVGYLFVAPIMTNYIAWLLKVVKENAYECILFAARDGYLMQKLYKRAIEALNLQNMPRDIYFLTSRMICAASSMETVEDIANVSALPFSGSAEELLKIRFGLHDDEILPFDKELYPDIQAYALAHEKKIVDKSREYRRRYLEYFKSLDIKDGSKVAYFDFVSTGTCQKYLTKILPCEITGVYFLYYLSDSTLAKKLSIRALFEKGFYFQEQGYIFNNYFFLETIVTSFDPSLSSFDENIKPVYRPETRSEGQLEYVRDMQSSIIDYLSEYMGQLYHVNEDLNPKVAELLFSCMDRKYTDIKCDTLNEVVLLDDFGTGKLQIVY
ncbi:hypothetical protein [Paenibacillus arenosi]|uniref:Hydrolase n=1 Tax=Paenibacillus arenosi TaxID=2774142 RepID=A0ABR9AV13_9BACL|nr:hypothetical protein [Paenibacillus arenosi]MBD8497956.1 hypothetical protein [Paenibacillus arenosi]